MGDIPQAAVRNVLLGRMEPCDFALLAPALRREALCRSATLVRAGAPIDTVYFPEDVVLAALEGSDAQGIAATALIGSERCAGWQALLGSQHWTHPLAVRAAPGSVLAIPAADLLEAADRSPRLLRHLLGFSVALVQHMGRSALSAAVQPLRRRLAALLLDLHDRVPGDDLPVTHSELAEMLGVRRAGTTDALHLLESTHAVRSIRGHLAIRDRPLLRQIAGEAYAGPAEPAPSPLHEVQLQAPRLGV